MNPRKNSAVSGVSLIELMIALAIGTVLVLGLVQVFSASRAAYQMSEGMARVQENARFAMDFLQRDLRMAGHFGCSTDQVLAKEAARDPERGLRLHFAGAPVPFPQNFEVSVQAYEAAGTAPGQNVTLGDSDASWSPGLPSQIQSLNPLGGSDVLVLRYLHGEGASVQGLEVGSSATVITIDPDRLGSLTSGGDGAPVNFGLADCDYVDIFHAAGGVSAAGSVTTIPAVGSRQAHPGMGASEWTAAGSELRLYRAESIVYYVATGASGGPSLFRARLDSTGYRAEELVEGVESLQFLFGQDNSASGPRGYVTDHHTAGTLANDPDEWAKVGMVQVGILGSSPNPAVAPDPTGEERQPNVLGVNFDASELADSRYRASYESSVAVRNRLFGN